MRAAIYLRVSTDEQTTDNQERELRSAAERIGHEIVAVYRDAGISGSKAHSCAHPGGFVLYCVSLRQPWNSSLAQGLVSRPIALRHWRTTDAAMACFNLYRSAPRI